MRLRHVLASQQFKPQPELIEQIFILALLMEQVAKSGGNNWLAGKILATLFYEPSTRTRLSFEAAMQRLGGRVISTENARLFSSAIKGETLADTIRIVSGYADAIVLRHFQTGASDTAASLDACPIINAGDGSGQHPTQALLDLFTIWRELGRIEGLTIGMMGDLKNGRTVRSLTYLLAMYRIKKIYFIAPPMFQIKEDILEYLKEKKVDWAMVSDPREVIMELDVLYQTRIQYERTSWLMKWILRILGRRLFEKMMGYRIFIIDRGLTFRMKRQAIIEHPMPIVNEIHPEVNTDPRAAFFRQAINGLYIRMALLLLCLGPEEVINEALAQAAGLAAHHGYDIHQALALRS